MFSRFGHLWKAIPQSSPYSVSNIKSAEAKLMKIRHYYREASRPENKPFGDNDTDDKYKKDPFVFG